MVPQLRAIFTPSSFPMHVSRLTTLDPAVLAPADWNRLAGAPFQTREWLSTWWKHYGPATAEDQRRRELFLLCVRDAEGSLVGLAPWYLEHRLAFGRVVRQLGDGDVCSDYLGILSAPDCERAVAAALADWMTQARGADRWDLLNFDEVDPTDLCLATFFDAMRKRRSLLHVRAGSSCWRVDFNGDWEDYLATFSKGHRKQIRRLERGALEDGRARLRQAVTREDAARGMDILIDLHQRRWRSLGDCGCFDSPRFTAFHREVVEAMRSIGALRLSWLEYEGQPVAAEYHLGRGGVVYAYQSGVDPDQLDLEPGRMIAVATIKQALDEGYASFDFLRGDESYKPHWRAVPQRMVRLRIVPARFTSQCRHRLWLAVQAARQWWKSFGAERIETTLPAKPQTVEADAPAQPESSPEIAVGELVESR
ncbi:MAG TPA: GNAT family N-acetyltransferase [Planctomycetaceae bacterium]|nr:GNAT family N-acetyltransferase [Planctomycetaceae bacterium]